MPTEPSQPLPDSRSITGMLRKHLKALALVLVAAAVAGFLWFRPDKLLLDTRVDEAPPMALASGNDPGLSVLAMGMFRDLEHDTDGTASIVRTASGDRLVRLEEFMTSSGPDLIVILSDTPATEDRWSAYDDGAFVALGTLKGNVGNQNYAISDGIDPKDFRSVVIWCRRFNVAFGAAPITFT